MTTAVADTHEAHNHHGPEKGMEALAIHATNHKDIGTMYLVFSLIMFFCGRLHGARSFAQS